MPVYSSQCSVRNPGGAYVVIAQQAGSPLSGKQYIPACMPMGHDAALMLLSLPHCFHPSLPSVPSSAPLCVLSSPNRSPYHYSRCEVDDNDAGVSTGDSRDWECCGDCCEVKDCSVSARKMAAEGDVDEDGGSFVAGVYCCTYHSV